MIALHVAIIFASYAAFFVAVLTGLAFLREERQLKMKDPKILATDAIPLERLDRVNLLAVVVGFIFFSFGMIQGLWLARTQWGSLGGSLDPKVVASLATWAAYAAVLLLRLKVGLRGRRVVFLSVMSFLLVLLTFVGVSSICTLAS